MGKDELQLFAAALCGCSSLLQQKLAISIKSS